MMRPWAVAAVWSLVPGPALAHASDRAVILTLPTGPYIWGAGLAVALTALVAAFGGRLPAFGALRLCVRPAILPRSATSWLAAITLFALICAGLFGSHNPLANPLPLMLWTVIWVGLTIACAAFGNLWRDIDPWTGPVRTLRGRLSRKAGIGLARLGHWPAVAGLFGFAWYEIISLSPDDPADLAVIIAVYWLVIFALAVAEGEDWLQHGEFLTVFFGYIARIAPFWAVYDTDRVTVMRGWPGAQIPALPPLGPSAAAFVTLMLASVSFDGLHQTFRWLALTGINPLEYPGRSAVTGMNTAGLLAMWALMAGLITAATPGARRGPVMLSFLTIAAGYHIAHYLVALLTMGQYAIAALDDPLQRGHHLLGLPDHWVSFGFLSRESAVARIWQAQWVIILCAHMSSVVLAERLGADSGGMRKKLSKIPLALLMVLYTVFGLWLLSAPAVG